MATYPERVEGDAEATLALFNSLWGYRAGRPARPAGEDLMDHVMSDDLDGIQRILRAHCSALEYANHMGQTPLIIAAYWGKHPALKALLAARAKPNVQNGMGRTALHYACENGKAGFPRLPGLRKCVVSLLEAGANPRLRDDANNLAVDIATDNELISMLASSRAPPAAHRLHMEELEGVGALLGVDEPD